MRRWAVVALFACMLPLQNTLAMTANDYFADGNRLFRDDLYWAALLRYRQAADEGLDSSVLHYNFGVAHYRAGQFDRAHQALLQALGDPSLRVATQYNLGLNAYAAGDSQEALRWFRLARDQNLKPKIQAYAVTAISRIRDEQAIPDEFEVRVAARKKKTSFGNLDFSARIGFGNDDNIFRSPDQPYVDLSDPAQPTVTPVVASGVYIPLQLKAKYRVNALEYEGFYAAYRLSGRYYQDAALDNANEYQHELSFGSDYRRKQGSREREVYSAFTVAQHDQTYFDPDDGGIRDVGGVLIGDRLNYLRYGPQLTMRQSHEKLALGIKLKGQLWNYEETLAATEYDHEYFLASLYGQYKLSSASLVRITIEGYSRRFGDRPAFDLDGQQRLGNPNIRYDYYSAAVVVRERIFRSLWVGFEVKRTERIDQYVGYNDYTRDSFGVEAQWQPHERFKIKMKGVYRIYDYPNALAFHNVAAGSKTHENAAGRVTATFRMTRRLSLVAEARYQETVSNDSRIQYERNQVMLSIRWDQ
jgi:tetratricopeptide (TPR) repeat protein